MSEGDVTDLTEDGAPDAGKGKKVKEKKVKEKKKDKNSKDSGDGVDGFDGEDGQKVKGKKKGGATGIIVLMLLVLFLLVGGFGTALFFDALGARMVVANAINDPLIDLVIWLDPGFNTVADRMRADAELYESRFRAREQAMDERDSAIIEKEYELQRLEEQISRREADMERREAQLEAMADRTIPLHRRDMTEQEFEDMVSLSNTYAQMAPEVAATIMVALHDPRDVAGLLYHMAERERAAIMTEMTPAFAAHVTEILLYY